MAVSPVKYSAVTLGAALVLLSASAFGRSPTTSPRQNVQIDAASSEIDYRNNTAVLRDISITQGDLKVRAKEAVAQGGVNFANNEWTFKGDVRITTANGSLSSDQANIIFVDNQISRARIEGSPASFEQLMANGKDTAHGTAGAIEYDIAANTVSLTQGAFLTYAGKDIRNENIVYNIRDQRITAKAKSPGERIHITIDPKSNTPAVDPAR